jgi:hypothetical protein
MPKILEDTLGNFEYVFQALTLLGVLYLVMKQANVNLSVSRGDGFAGNHGIRFMTQSTGATHGGDGDAVASRQGFSMSGYEAPVWHATAVDPNELNLVAAEQAAANVDYNNLGAQRVFATDKDHLGSNVKWTTEGMRGRSYSRASVENMSMDSKLMNSLAGGNAGLQ